MRIIPIRSRAVGKVAKRSGYAHRSSARAAATRRAGDAPNTVPTIRSAIGFLLASVAGVRTARAVTAARRMPEAVQSRRDLVEAISRC